MRIAFFTPYLPYPPDSGGKIRSYYLLRSLAARFELDLYTVCHGAAGPSAQDVATLRVFCRQVTAYPIRKDGSGRARLATLLGPLPRSVDYFFTPESLRRARQDLQEGDYDLVVADEICTTPYAELAESQPRLVLRQKVDYLHYRDMAQARPWGVEKALDLIESVKLANYEKAKMPLYQGYLACSSQEAAIIGRYAPGVPALAIPNGADLSSFVPEKRVELLANKLLFVGSMHYYPNVDAIQYFMDKMYPAIRQGVPDVQLEIVGHSPLPEVMRLGSYPGVTVTGTVPDVRPYYGQATAFVVPLRLGRGTRLKIVEAMAMGVPVVSTTIGAEGLDVHDGEDILIADDAASFVQAVLRLLADPTLRARIGEGGRVLARRYDWTELARPLAELAAQVVALRKNPPGN
jgi:polysaccharide biosynthesis protein PslH